MIRALHFIAIFIGLVLPGEAAQSEFAQQLQKKMPGLLAKHNVPGAEIACIHNGEVAWSRAYGTLNVQTNEPMRPGLIFNFGSCGKVLTAWGIMRLVEQGRIDLDHPANCYLRRYQIQSGQFDPSEVTVRRLLSHMAGLTVHGFSDYGQGERLPSLVEMLNGGNQSDGSVYIKWRPGSQFHYSGGGFVILQMIIEDVTDESFADFMQREVTDSLGMTSLHWVWTSELIRKAAIPYDKNNQPVGYRQLACQAIGSEVGTVSDFARFVAAAMEGSKRESAGRGVLKPETVRQMLQAQPDTKGTQGLGYGLRSVLGEPIAAHAGGNPGWSAVFCLDPLRREGFVFAASSSNASPLESAIAVLWFQTVVGPLLMGRTFMWISAFLGLSLALSMLWFRSQVRSGRRAKASFKMRRTFVVMPWLVLALAWGCLFYSPLLIPLGFADAWPPQVHIVMAVFSVWVLFSFFVTFFPRERRSAGEAGPISEH